MDVSVYVCMCMYMCIYHLSRFNAILPQGKAMTTEYFNISGHRGVCLIQNCYEERIQILNDMQSLG